MRGEEDSAGEHGRERAGYALILRTSTSPPSWSWRVQWAVRWGEAGSAAGWGWGRELCVSGREGVDIVRELWMADAAPAKAN